MPTVRRAWQAKPSGRGARRRSAIELLWLLGATLLLALPVITVPGRDLRAEHGRSLLACVAATVVVMALAVPWFAITTYMSGGCYDVCDPRTGRWKDDPDAWQWTARYVSALVAMVAAALVVRFIVLRKDGAMVAGGGVSAAAGAAAFAWP
jgi:hypothetical protein